MVLAAGGTFPLQDASGRSRRTGAVERCAAVSFVSCQVKDIFEDQHQLQLDTYDLGTGALES